MNNKVYLQNPYLEDLQGKILKKHKKDGIYHIILDRTIFHPRYSEFPIMDKGTIDGFKVIDVFEEDGDIVHVVKENISSKDIEMKIDWNIRFEYMQQHTGQHILSACINKLCEANTLKFSFDENYSYIIIDKINLNDSEIRRIEKLANHMIYSNFQIESSNKQENGESKRIISIDDIYTTECDSIHCSSTGEIGLVKITNYISDEDGNIKVNFLCGNRALKDYNSKEELIKKLSNMLSVEQKNIYEKIERILDDNKRLEELKN